jgi:hypothetical protein
MTHAESRELLLDFAYGELPAHVAVEVEEHLTGCDECRVQKQQLDGVRKAFAPIRESEEPGVGFDERILAAARAEARLEHDGNIGQVVEVAASVAPAGLDAARVNAHAASVAPPPVRTRPRWMTRAMLGGSVAAAAALALVVSASLKPRERQMAQAENFEIHVAPQSAQPLPEAAKDKALARNDAAPAEAAPPPAAPSPAPAAAAPVVPQPSSDRFRASLAAKKSKARAIDEGSGGDVPNAAELALRGALAENESKAQAGGGARAASNDAPAPSRDRLAAAAPEPQAPADEAAAGSSLQKKEAAAAAPRSANPGDLERRAETARHGGNYALAAGLYREAASGRESDSSAAAWDLAHAVECLAAAGSFDEARKVRDQLGTSYPVEANALAAARRALREVDSNSKY